MNSNTLRTYVKSAARRLVKLALLVVVVLAPILIIPEFFDPLKLHLWDDTYQLMTKLECTNEDCTLYQLPSGTVTYPGGWVVTTQADGFRLTPDNGPDCTVNVAVLGDSYVWGYLISDDETWVNRLAQHFPEACFHNYGQFGYNATQAAWTLEQFVPDTMDYVVYFIFQNDDYPVGSLSKDRTKPNSLIALRYINLILWQFDLPGTRIQSEKAESRDAEEFASSIHQMARDPRVQFVGFEEELLVHVVREMGYDAFGIAVPPKEWRVSAIDDHPNADGHFQMAQDMYPLFERLFQTPSHNTDSP